MRRALLRNALASMSAVARWPEYCPLLGNERLAWREMRNKIDAFSTFQFADQIAAHDHYSRVWATEGLAYHRAVQTLAHDTSPQNLIPLDSPVHWLVPLHSGTATAFAIYILRARLPIAYLQELHRRNAHPDYEAVMREGLGLAVCTLYPEIANEIDRVLPESWHSYFWHGFGRGLYFAPTCLLPRAGPLSRLLENCRKITADSAARDNMTAGIAWAFTLVNIRDPELVSRVLGHVRMPDPLCDGHRAALEVWSQMTHPAPAFNPASLFHFEAAGASSRFAGGVS